MPVARLNTRGLDQSGDALTSLLEDLEKKGTITSILPLQDEILVVWVPKKREQRETRAT